MTTRPMTAEAISLLVRSVNCLLAAENSAVRVTPEITLTRRGGVTFIALQEERKQGKRRGDDHETSQS